MDAVSLLQKLRDAERAYRTTLHEVQEHGGALFKAVRKEQNLTQRQLANILHVDFSFISKIENGHMRPGKPILERLAAYLAEQLPTAQDGSEKSLTTPVTTPSDTAP